MKKNLTELLIIAFFGLIFYFNSKGWLKDKASLENTPINISELQINNNRPEKLDLTLNFEIQNPLKHNILIEKFQLKLLSQSKVLTQVDKNSLSIEVSPKAKKNINIPFSISSQEQLFQFSNLIHQTSGRAELAASGLITLISPTTHESADINYYSVIPLPVEKVALVYYR
ncbi:MAG: hypothetical protein A3H98_05940 [Bacteroidetes bacterium RIFCSPLOWO2_02_FULL_36_8]|nr:MAG: hypothetical protein A3H98_05940 [Bacteroidetes bacterium RIFCSPLOWO2_02_FULL_36_8]OFY70791.1 MAG: hypothetical protein A3G23_13370 [Bacteroidetes bacterium RIFCSPLOWO2_12_FULL_37_12]